MSSRVADVRVDPQTGRGTEKCARDISFPRVMDFHEGGGSMSDFDRGEIDRLE
jgi:hypothetical protein